MPAKRVLALLLLIMGLRVCGSDGDGIERHPVVNASLLRQWRAWDIYPDSWKRLIISPRDAADGVMHVNDASFCHNSQHDLEAESPQVLQALQLPVYVLNLPSKPDRRAHMLCLLGSLGFRNIFFPKVVQLSELEAAVPPVDPHHVDIMRKSAGCNKDKPLGCLACCLSHLAAHEAARARNHTHFIILEDDLILGGSVRTVRARLSAALAELPPSADMLYLEACYEDCRNVRYSRSCRQIGRAHRPYCGGGILFTAAGSARVLRNAKPPWSSIDEMYSELIDDLTLEAYIVAPPILYQSFFFGSSLETLGRVEAARRGIAGLTHRHYAALCAKETPYSVLMFAEAQTFGAYHLALLAAAPADLPWMQSGTFGSVLDPSSPLFFSWERRRRSEGLGGLNGDGAHALDSSGSSQMRAGGWESGWEDQAATVVMMSDPMIEKLVRLSPEYKVTFFTRDREAPMTTKQVGIWPFGQLREHAVALLLDSSCVCAHTLHTDGCELLVVTEDALGVTQDSARVLLPPSRLLHTPMPPRLVCYLVSSAKDVDTDMLQSSRSRVIALTWEHPSSSPATLYLHGGLSPSQHRAELFARMYVAFVAGDTLAGLSADGVRPIQERLHRSQPAVAWVCLRCGGRSRPESLLDPHVMAAVRWDLWYDMAYFFVNAARAHATSPAAPRGGEVEEGHARADAGDAEHISDTSSDHSQGSSMKFSWVVSAQEEEGREDWVTMDGDRHHLRTITVWMHDADDGDTSSFTGAGGVGGGLHEVAEAVARALNVELRFTNGPGRSANCSPESGVERECLSVSKDAHLPPASPTHTASVPAFELDAGPAIVMLQGGKVPVDVHAQEAVLTAF